MKVLLINTNDTSGGAAIACRRLTEALLQAGVDARMLVLQKTTPLPQVTGIAVSRPEKLKSKLAFLAERLQIFLQNGFSRKRLFTVSTATFGFDLSDHPLVRQADVIHLHWVNHGMLSLAGLDKLLRMGKPIVWTMHDLWESTGICHYPSDCMNYTDGCGRCPQLHSSSASDLSARIMKRKEAIIPNAGVRFVGCSEWIVGEARKSKLAMGNRYAAIPNPIDTGLFSPGDRMAARRRLGLPEDKKLILFGAANAADERKGLAFLLEATRILNGDDAGMALVMCGKFKRNPDFTFGLPLYEMGFVADTSRMVDIYRAADLFVTPSLEDNLPNMLMESMACGVPCVGFRVGGIPEMIKHRQTGYLADYRSSEDLAAGIRWVLQAGCEPGENARRFVQEHYDPAIVARAYLKQYQESINQC